MCNHEWIRKMPLLEKTFPDLLHRYSFSPLWRLMCCVSEYGWSNFLSQSLQAYRRSPVWRHKCVFSTLGHGSPLLQEEQTYSFTLAWAWRCCPRRHFVRKVFSHLSQRCSCSSVGCSVLRCRVNVIDYLKLLQHAGQVRFLVSSALVFSLNSPRYNSPGLWYCPLQAPLRASLVSRKHLVGNNKEGLSFWYDL